MVMEILIALCLFCLGGSLMARSNREEFLALCLEIATFVFLVLLLFLGLHPAHAGSRALGRAGFDSSTWLVYEDSLNLVTAIGDVQSGKRTVTLKQINDAGFGDRWAREMGLSGSFTAIPVSFRTRGRFDVASWSLRLHTRDGWHKSAGWSSVNELATVTPGPGYDVVYFFPLVRLDEVDSAAVVTGPDTWGMTLNWRVR